MMDIWSYLIGLIPAIITGGVLFYAQRAQKRRDTKADERERARNEEAMLSLDLEMATAKLAYATAVAWKRGEPNGEVDDGIKAYKEALEKFQKFERKEVTRL